MHTAGSCPLEESHPLLSLAPDLRVLPSRTVTHAFPSLGCRPAGSCSSSQADWPRGSLKYALGSPPVPSLPVPRPLRPLLTGLQSLSHPTRLPVPRATGPPLMHYVGQTDLTVCLPQPDVKPLKPQGSSVSAALRPVLELTGNRCCKHPRCAKCQNPPCVAS